MIDRTIAAIESLCDGRIVPDQGRQADAPAEEPAAEPKVKPAGKKNKAHRAAEPKVKPAGKRKKAHRVAYSRKDSTSKFQGVRRVGNYKDGRPRFEAIYYDPETDKPIYLGRRDNEYLAAALYQDRVGNAKRAHELRAMAEQAGNNPDKPKPAARKKIVYVCKRCGLEYRTVPKGAVCPKCNNDDFREVPEQ